ncbi:hypothetical protein CYMTET_21260 [Cymbomonas tetramitiformis]|uniref:Tudor domain-containing protein n=1 Tax=Cymbomonas tetramitiformis TaxID=36881 RepID=A0AAE0G2H9_9CHLO|nr:hypothetical protein CYMTET_21260 [Cymbomonas tetramitiformis]
MAGCREDEAAGERSMDEIDVEVTRIASRFGAKAGSSTTCTTASNVTVGSRIEVFGEDDDCFYPGVVKEFNEDGKAHVLYDDGDEETLDLSKENFKIIDSSAVSELTNEATDTDSENIDLGGDYKVNKSGGALENFLTHSLCERLTVKRSEGGCGRVKKWRAECGRVGGEGRRSGGVSKESDGTKKKARRGSDKWIVRRSEEQRADDEGRGGE